MVSAFVTEMRPIHQEDFMKIANRSLRFLLGLSVLLALFTNPASAANPHCSQIGGMILTNVGGFGTIDGQLTTLGVATGDLSGALGVQIVSASPDFTSITVQHHWVTTDGETLNFDQATLKGTWVSPTILAVVSYKPHLSGGTGRFAGATADTSAIGELDFNTGHVALRYTGTLCTSGN
jgi:hypothetical protein